MTPVRTSTTRSPSTRPWLSSRDRRVLDSVFSIDTRALSVVRILLAVLILFQSLILQQDEPRDANGLVSLTAQYAHLAIVPFALMLLAGFRTKLALFVCWLLYSTPIRADLMADIPTPMGHYTLNLALFWCLFLPMDRHLSWTTRRQRQAPLRYLSVASGGFLFQIVIIYLSAGLFKDRSEWLTNATAMESILSNAIYETSVGTLLLQFPYVLAIMSVASVAVEVIGSLLVMIPGKSLAVRRLIVVPVFILFHVGIAVLMGLTMFPYVMMAVWLLFLPSTFWDRVWGWFVPDRVEVQVAVDGNRWRNLLAGAAVSLAAVSNLITFIFYANYEDLPFLVDRFEDIVISLTIHQRWIMFNVPSMLP